MSAFTFLFAKKPRIAILSYSHADPTPLTQNSIVVDKLERPNSAMLRLGCHESLPKLVAALQLRAFSAVSRFRVADGLVNNSIY